jgi:hypothetical protein
MAEILVAAISPVLGEIFAGRDFKERGGVWITPNLS